MRGEESSLSYTDLEFWRSAGFKVSENNAGRHVVITSDKLHISLWPTSTDADDRPKWMVFGKTFHAAPSTMAAAYRDGRLKMPLEAKQAKCRSCDADIWWMKTSNGKNIPLDVNGTAHFTTCPSADQHRRRAG